MVAHGLVLTDILVCAERCSAKQHLTHSVPGNFAALTNIRHIDFPDASKTERTSRGVLLHRWLSLPARRARLLQPTDHYFLKYVLGGLF